VVWHTAYIQSHMTTSMLHNQSKSTKALCRNNFLPWPVEKAHVYGQRFFPPLMSQLVFHMLVYQEIIYVQTRPSPHLDGLRDS